MLGAIVGWSVVGIAVLLGIIALFGSFYTVEQQTSAIIERFGKFMRKTGPGLHAKIPFIEHIADRVSLKVREHPVPVESKSKDDVFVVLKISVQYQVLPDKVYDAHYKLTDHKAQMTSYVHNVVRAVVPTMDINDVFENKEKIAVDVKNTLQGIMDDYGYNIITALVADIEPDAKVKQAMNAVRAAEREKEAVIKKAEGLKQAAILEAEGNAERQRLEGTGLSNQRKEVIKGFKDAAKDFKEAFPGGGDNAVLNLVVLLQYMDVLKEIGARDKATLLSLPHSPAGMTDLAKQIGESMTSSVILGNAATKELGEKS